ncbi:hypothetical protein CLONEX_03527, partial [[Clostridium] nexile DSM 1787]
TKSRLHRLLSVLEPKGFEFHSTALSSIDDATASPHSAALQTENSFCVIMLKVNETVH